MVVAALAGTGSSMSYVDGLFLSIVLVDHYDAADVSMNKNGCPDMQVTIFASLT